MTKVRQILPIYLIVFIGYVGYSLMITVFTPMVMHADLMVSTNTSMSYRVIVLGILLCLYPLGQFLGSPILGAFSDQYGRKRVMMISLSLTTFFYILIAASLTIDSLGLLMLSSFLAGLCEANVAIAQSSIADITIAQNRSRLFGYIYIFASSAYIIGPLVGGKLADPNLVSWFNYATPFWVVFCLLLVTLFLLHFLFSETKSNYATEKIHYLSAFTNLLNVFLDRRIRVLYLIIFLLYLSTFGFFRSYPMYLVDEYKMNVSVVSEYIAWVAVPIIIANLWLTGFLAKRFSAKKLAMASAIFAGFFMITIIIPRHESFLWVTLFLTSLGISICMPVSAALLSNSVSQQEQGQVMGNNASLQVGAEALSGVVSGLLAAVAIKLPLIVLAIIAFLAVAILKVRL